MEAGAMPSASEAVTNAMPKAEVPPEIMAIKNDTSAVPSFREKKAGIDESTKNSLQRTNPDDVSEIFSQAELHKTNPNVNPSPMKVIANKSADVISDIDKKISTSNAIADSTLLPTTNVDLIPVVKSFTDNIEKELGGKIV